MSSPTNQDIIDKFDEHDEWEKQERLIETALTTLTESVTNVRINVASITERMKSIDDSLVTLNHNSASTSERLAVLESANQRNADFQDFAKKLAATVAGIIGIAATVLSILAYVRVI